MAFTLIANNCVALCKPFLNKSTPLALLPAAKAGLSKFVNQATANRQCHRYSVDQLCPTPGTHEARSKVLCGPV